MQHIHAREHLRAGAAVRVDCDHQCNVLVMDDHNYVQYRRGGPFRHLGGFYQRLPAVIQVPTSGYWNVALDLAGGHANIRHSISYVG